MRDGVESVDAGGQMRDGVESVDAGSQEWVSSGWYDHYLKPRSLGLMPPFHMTNSLLP